MKRAVVTGATGFVGANLVRRLLREDHEVHIFARRGAAPWRVTDLQNDVHWHEVDLGDADTTVQVVGRIRPDWVFHMAATALIRRKPISTR
jgi:nucleoside-diphosphate-sugar epimerase